MKRNKLTYFFTVAAILIGTLSIGSSPADSRPATRTLQSLPNGIYFYSNARLPRQQGAEYVLIRKNGRYFLEYGYAYQSDSSCKSGTIRGNTLNETRRFDSDDSERGV